ncbi:unnamed protein product [Staurois parvus]|uniref:Uncharacterized protein n=1 Tax=Staurois parvus TaxID=386267 RepID=A0ABN9EY82_9NEOB|nr:unnamed protein product [Staurois parvus]
MRQRALPCQQPLSSALPAVTPDLCAASSDPCPLPCQHGPMISALPAVTPFLYPASSDPCLLSC